VTAETLGKLERIAALGIKLLPLGGIQTHFVFERDGCAVLVERRADGFGAPGGPGLLTESGFAALVERDLKPWFIGKLERREATPEEAAAARKLFTDLKSALS
jgi:hypothetical protein